MILEEIIVNDIKATKVDETNYEVLNLLAHSYRLNEEYDKAAEIFQKIVDKFPGTKRAQNAQKYVDNGGHGFDEASQAAANTGDTGQGAAAPTEQ